MKKRFGRETGLWIFLCSTGLFLAAIMLGFRMDSGSERRFLVAVITIVGVLVSCFYCYTAIQQKRKEEEEKAQIQSQIDQFKMNSKAEDSWDKNSEFLALQNQINPHFLYNTLDSIRGQALIDGAEEVADMTEALSSFFRYSISRRSNLVMLCDELRNIDNYMKIQQFRFEDKYVLEKQIDCDKEALNVQIPKMILQPLVENAIFHGVESLEEQGRVTLRVSDTPNKIRITVEDNGVGIEPAVLQRLNRSFRDPLYRRNHPPAPGRGIALPNVNDRIQLYFGREYGIFIRSVAGTGTQVEVLIPKQKEIQISEGKN